MTSIGPKKLFKLPSLKKLSPFPTPSTDEITYPSIDTSLHSLKTTHFQSPNTSSPPLQPPLQTFISPHTSSINQSISPPFPLPSVTQSPLLIVHQKLILPFAFIQFSRNKSVLFKSSSNSTLYLCILILFDNSTDLHFISQVNNFHNHV